MTARVISIGTTHPHNIAGVGLDIQIAREFGIEVFTVVAGVSAQSDSGVTALHAIPASIVLAQLTASVMSEGGAVVEGPPPVMRIGALVTAANVRIVADFARSHPEIPAVVDPVISTSTGGRLLDDDAITALRDELATQPGVVLTPNLDEAAILLGIDSIARDDLASAAKALRDRGCRAVVLKGGHLAGDPIDALATADSVELLRGERINASMRGTGCTLAMAMACELARGLTLRDTVESARSFVRGQLVCAADANASLGTSKLE